MKGDFLFNDVYMLFENNNNNNNNNLSYFLLNYHSFSIPIQYFYHAVNKTWNKLPINATEGNKQIQTKQKGNIILLKFDDTQYSNKKVKYAFLR